MTWYVHRLKDGSIASAHRAPQKGYAEEELADDSADIVAYFAPPTRTYRERRATRYISDLAKPEERSPTFMTTVGDVLDEVLTQVEAIRLASGAERTSGFDRIVKAVASIKAEIPKPQ